MLVFFRPFKVGDQIEAAGTGGVVESIGIFNTVLKTGDNRVINVPNSLVYAGTITNYNAEGTRRIDLTLTKRGARPAAGHPAEDRFEPPYFCGRGPGPFEGPSASSSSASGSPAVITNL